MIFKRILTLILFLNAFVFADEIVEPLPTITVKRISDYEISEKDASTKKAQFKITLSESSLLGLSLDYKTIGIWSKATKGSDYLGEDGSVFFLPLQTEKIVEFEIVNDSLKGEIDPNELTREYFQFQLVGDAPEGYVYKKNSDYQLIIDDDVNSIKYGWGNSVIEGDENTTSKVLFKIYLNQPLTHDLVLNYNTIDNTAKAGEDFVYSEGSLTFKAGETYKNFSVPVIGDKIKEVLKESFFVHLTTNDPDFKISSDMSGTIIDDDTPIFYVSAGEEKLEGNAGQTCIPFNIKLTKPINEQSSVFFKSYDGTAKLEYNDYTEIKNQEVIFAPNEMQKQVCVYANGDTKVEANEDVGIELIHSSDNTTVNGGGKKRNIANMINNDDNATHASGTCTSDMFISRSLHNRMFISKIDISQNPFKFNMLEEAGSEDIYNALVYSEVDNFMYALDKRELLQIGINGTIVKMGQVSGLPSEYDTKQLFGGATYGGYYYVTGTATLMQQIFKIKLSDKSVETINLDKAVDLLDISPTPDGKYLYGIDNKKKLTKVEVATGHVEFIGSDHTDVQFDTTYSDVNGKFYANDSGGKGFYEINLLTGEKAFRSPSSKATFNDGANCINAPLVFTDFADAPSSYGDASHNIIGNLILGKNIDHDISPYYSYDAMGDDVNGSDDEDGVVMNDANKTELSKASLYPNKPYSFSVDASNHGYLTAWIDYNLNGTFEDTEKIASALAMVKGNNIVNFTSPANLELFKTSFVRFRFASAPVVSAVGLIGDGEVEDYKINFGPAKKPIKANFNIERVNSNPAGGDFNLYTQISGRDFDYSVVAYEDKNDSTTPQILSDVTVKVELFDVMDNKKLLYTKYVYFPKDNNGTKRINIIEPNDLALNLASRDLNFKATSLVDSSGFIIQGDFSDEVKFNAMMNAVKKVNSAKDDFAIRPASFDVSMSDNAKVLAKNALRLSAGYTYNLSPTATLYNPAGVGANVKNYTGLLDSSVLAFIDKNNPSCVDTQDVEVKGIDFKDGIGKKSFSHHNSGKYKLKVQDNIWSQIDSMKEGCIVNSSVVSTSPNEKSGCDIASEDINMAFYPYKFGLDNIVVKNSNNSSHNEFVYMNDLATNQAMAVSVEGDVEAQNFNGGITTNFSNGCDNEDVNLALEYSGESDEGAFLNNSTGKILTKQTRQARAFVRKDIVNGIPVAGIKNADAPLLINKANIKEGVSSAKMLFNIQRDLNEMNPVQIDFKTMVATSPNSYSSANGVDNYVPTGSRVLNAMRMFYYARLAPDKINYPITYDGSEDTPLYAEIYCNHTVDFCKNMIRSNGLHGSRTQQGWYTSIKHQSGAVDGQVLNIRETAINADDVNTSGNFNIMPRGKTANLTTRYAGSNPMDSKMEITNISPWLKFNNQYWLNHFRQTKEGKWAGVGQTGHTVKIETNGTTSKKIDW